MRQRLHILLPDEHVDAPRAAVGSWHSQENAMTTELRWLVYTALLAASLWIPYIVGINTTDFEGKKELFTRPPDHSKMPPWVHRSLRAHQNLLEQFLPYAAIVLVGAVVHVSNSVTAACAIIF